MKRRLIVIDTETSGLDPRAHDVLSFGAVIYDQGSITGEFYTLIQHPTVTWENGAEDVNGLDTTNFSTSPTPWRAVLDFRQWLARNMRDGQQILVCHGAQFDVPFLRALWSRAGQDFEKQFSHRFICTQSLAALLDQAGRIDLPAGNTSLDNVAAAFGLSRSGGQHNALEDAHLVARILAKMVERIK